MLQGLTNPNLLLAGMILAGVQLVAALPWLYAVDPKSFRGLGRNPAAWLYLALALLGAGVGVAAFLGYNSDSARLEQYGKYGYGAVLHLQLIVDFFLLMPAVLTLALPKTGAVAYASFRE